MAVARLICSYVAVALVLITAAGTRADSVTQAPAPSADAEESAQSWFERGVSLSRAAEWSAARDAYVRSLQLEPRVSTHFNLAAASLQLQLGRATLLALDEFELRADPRTHAEFLAEAARMRAEALGLTGTVILTVSPRGASVEIDREAGVWPMGLTHTINLDPGHHVLQLRAPEYVADKLEVDVTRGMTTRLSVALRPMPMPVAVAAVGPEKRGRESKETTVWGDVLLWGGVSVLGVAVVTTVLVLVLQPGSTSMPKASGGSVNILLE